MPAVLLFVVLLVVTVVSSSQRDKELDRRDRILGMIRYCDSCKEAAEDSSTKLLRDDLQSCGIDGARFQELCSELERKNALMIGMISQINAMRGGV